MVIVSRSISDPIADESDFISNKRTDEQILLKLKNLTPNGFTERAPAEDDQHDVFGAYSVAGTKRIG
jgi:hypothetical protein